MVLSLTACGGQSVEGDGHDHGAEEATAHGEDNGHGEEEEPMEREIHLTKNQIETVGIAFGDISSIKINDYIRATGTLGLPPQSNASVSARAGGFIKNSAKLVEGMYVKKGAIVAFLENPEFIRQQQEYLEVSAALIYLEQELERQQSLIDSNAGVMKNLQKLQSEVNIKTATLMGLGKQLAYLGIDVADLSPENIAERIPIIASMSGYLTAINMHNGMYVTPQIELMEIVSDDHLHLELDVFEKDIAFLKEEQKISYTVPALGNTVYDAEVHIIGKQFDLSNKTVRIHGHLENEQPQFIKDLFVDAKIWLNDQTVSAVPENAIIRDGASSYIYMTPGPQGGDEVKFEKVMVIPGTTDKGYTSVKLMHVIPEGMKIVTEGAYYVYAQSMAGELEHEH
ncbi:MAG: efflux transporter periplasmic adaptor subunit [Bacteroidetes bacterium]|nr:MAG: efflux transporter periplasmic adaptor subunit [Bacteroidota bacterium]